MERLELRTLLSATPTILTVSASANSVVNGQPLNLRANVSASPSPPSEGNVAFFDNGTPLGTAAVTSGVAALDNAILLPGTALITASYSDASGNFASSSSSIGPDSIITAVAGGETQGAPRGSAANPLNGDGGLAVGALLNNPGAVAVDSSGDLFIADDGDYAVREVNHATHIITTVLGISTAAEYVDSAWPLPGEFSFNGMANVEIPSGLAVDSSGDLFIAENAYFTESDGEIIQSPFDSRVVEVDLATRIVSNVAGNGTFAHEVLGFSGDGGPATAAELDGVGGLAIDSSGDLFIADRFNNAVREVNLATGIITTVAGNGTQGFIGDGGPATAAELDGVGGLAVDSSGDLFIADTGNDVVREVNLATGIINTVAGNGIAGFSGDGGAATAAELNNPTGVAIDSSGDLFIADSENDVVREVNLATGIINTAAGNGIAGFSGGGGAASSAELNGPAQLAVDSSGDLLIADSGNNRIREVQGGAVVHVASAPNAATNAQGTVYTLSDAASGGWLEMRIAGSGITQVIDTNVSSFGLDASGAAVALEDSGILVLFPANSSSRETMLSGVENFIIDASGVVTALLATPNTSGNLYRFAPGSATPERLEINSAHTGYSRLVDDLGVAVAFDGTSLYYFPDDSTQSVQMLAGMPIGNLLIDGSGTIVGMVGGSLFRVSPGTDVSMGSGDTASHFADVALDGKGNVVALDSTRTLWFFDAGANIPTKMASNVSTFTVDAAGSVVALEQAAQGATTSPLVRFAPGSTSPETLMGAGGTDPQEAQELEFDGSGSVVALDAIGNLVRFAPGSITEQLMDSGVVDFLVDAAGFVTAQITGGRMVQFAPGSNSAVAISDGTVTSIALDGTGSVIALNTDGDLERFSPASTTPSPMDPGADVSSFKIDNDGQVLALESTGTLVLLYPDPATAAYDRAVQLQGVLFFEVVQYGWVHAVVSVSGSNSAPYEVEFFMPAQNPTLENLQLGIENLNFYPLVGGQPGTPVVTQQVSQFYPLADGSILVTIKDVWDSFPSYIAVPPGGLYEMYLVEQGDNYVSTKEVPQSPKDYSATFFWVTGVSVTNEDGKTWDSSQSAIANEFGTSWSYTEPAEITYVYTTNPLQIFLDSVGFLAGAFFDYLSGGVLTPVIAEGLTDLLGSAEIADAVAPVVEGVIANSAEQGAGILINGGSFNFAEALTSGYVSGLGLDDIGDVGSLLSDAGIIDEGIVSEALDAVGEHAADELETNLLLGGSKNGDAAPATQAATAFGSDVAAALQTSAISSTFLRDATSFLNNVPAVGADVPFLNSATPFLNGALGGNWSNPSFASFADAGASLLEQIAADGYSNTAFARYAASQLLQAISGGASGISSAQSQLESLESAVASTPSGAVPLLPLAASGHSKLTATAGTAFTGELATFTDPNGAGAASDYTATIDWGDKTSASAGSITGADANGVFTVTGSHAYAEETASADTVTVVIGRTGSPDATTTDSANVSDAALAATPATLTATAGASQTFNVATFTDPGGAQAVGDYDATINWGDGVTADNGTVTLNSGVFTVAGSHTWFIRKLRTN